LPAIIDYALDTTNQTQLNYIGHSQGTTTFFVMLSTRPDYNQKIATAFLLCPVVFLKNIPNPLLKFMGLNTEWVQVKLENLSVIHPVIEIFNFFYIENSTRCQDI
jgi:lysosomal acid lipase/cholesteryl ester hydrolase